MPPAYCVSRRHIRGRRVWGSNRVALSSVAGRGSLQLLFSCVLSVGHCRAICVVSYIVRKTRDSVVATANVTADHARARVSRGRPRRRLETQEEQARRTVVRDRGRRPGAEQVAARRAVDQEYRRHRLRRCYMISGTRKHDATSSRMSSTFSSCVLRSAAALICQRADGQMTYRAVRHRHLIRVDATRVRRRQSGCDI